MRNDLNISDKQLKEFCELNGIKKLSLFGSIITDNFSNQSDIDVLVEFDNGKVPGLLKMVSIERELTNLIGRKVDLKTPAELSKYFRENVVKEAEVKYG